MTSQEEADYYKSQAEQCKVLAKSDSDFIIIAERFEDAAERWQKKADDEKKTDN